METYDFQLSKARGSIRIAIDCISLREGTTILYVPASFSGLLDDLCKDHVISTIEQAQHDPDLRCFSVSNDRVD